MNKKIEEIILFKKKYIKIGTKSTKGFLLDKIKWFIFKHQLYSRTKKWKVKY